jgi:hypothetical protein
MKKMAYIAIKIKFLNLSILKYAITSTIEKICIEW